MAKTLDQNIMAVLATSGPMLTPAQLSWLTPDQLSWLTPAQLRGLGNGLNYQVENLGKYIPDESAPSAQDGGVR
jgi:hypothetical protein